MTGDAIFIVCIVLYFVFASAALMFRLERIETKIDKLAAPAGKDKP